MEKRTYVSLVVKYPDNKLARYMTPKHPRFKELAQDPTMAVCDEIRDKHGAAECVWREDGVTLVTAWPLEAVVATTYIETY